MSKRKELELAEITVPFAKTLAGMLSDIRRSSVDMGEDLTPIPMKERQLSAQQIKKDLKQLNSKGELRARASSQSWRAGTRELKSLKICLRLLKTNSKVFEKR